MPARSTSKVTDLVKDWSARSSSLTTVGVAQWVEQYRLFTSCRFYECRRDYMLGVQVPSPTHLANIAQWQSTG